MSSGCSALVDGRMGGAGDGVTGAAAAGGAAVAGAAGGRGAGMAVGVPAGAGEVVAVAAGAGDGDTGAAGAAAIVEGAEPRDWRFSRSTRAVRSSTRVLSVATERV